MTRLITTLAMIALLSGCGLVHSTQPMADVTKAETITLTKKPRQGGIHYLTVSGSGEIQGAAGISLIESGKPYRSEKLSGPVKAEWETEWSSDTADIRYEPKSIAAGNLRLENQFRD